MGVLLAVHAAATAAMVGLIWFVQVVHYPLFRRVGVAGFAAYARAHQQRTSWVVAPLMGAEAATAIALVGAVPAGPARWLAIGGLALVVVIWFSTLLWQVPCHRRLLAGYDEAVVRRLVRGNWVRTLAWSCRAVLVFMLVAAVHV
ncbi:MAG: hypothetical protein H6816_14075 [Phycisphaerales bacterium]|nr:hypothetical protein [Phycisphaerales bacterium]